MECQETIPQESGVTNKIRYDINIQEIKNKLNKAIPVRPHGQPG